MKLHHVWNVLMLAIFVDGYAGEMKSASSGRSISTDVYYGSSPLLEETKRTAEFDGYMTIFDEKFPLFRNLKPLKGAAPLYPADDRKKGLEGSLIVNVIVDTDGTVETFVNTEIKATGPMTQTAAAAVREWIFPPIKQKGKKVRFIAEVPIFFKLDGRIPPIQANPVSHIERR